MNKNTILEMTLGNLIVALTDETNLMRNGRSVNVFVSETLRDLLMAPHAVLEPIED